MLDVFLDPDFPSGHRKSPGAHPSYKQTEAESNPGRATSSSQATVLSIWGVGTLLKSTSAVLQMWIQTSSGASTSSNFLSLVSGTKNPPRPSLVPYRLTCTSLILLFSCHYSVIVRNSAWIQSGCGKTLKPRNSPAVNNKAAHCCDGRTTSPVWWIIRDGPIVCTSLFTRVTAV